MSKKVYTAVALTVLVIVAVLFTFRNNSSADEYTVSPTGSALWSQCNSKGSATPCSAATAMANAEAGDVVYFRGGTYTPENTVTEYAWPAMYPANNGTSGNPITFIAYPGETPVITDNTRGGAFGCLNNQHIVWDGFSGTIVDWPNNENQLVSIWYSSYCEIRNCDLKGIVKTTHHNNALIFVHDSDHTTIENCRLHDNLGDFTVADPGVNSTAVMSFHTSYTTMINNDFYNTTRGIFDKEDGHYNTYAYNHFYDDAGTDKCKRGVWINSQGSAPSSNITIRYNVFSGCSEGVLFDGPNTSDYVKIYNNVFYGDSVTDAAAIYSTDNTRDLEVYNNLIFNFRVHLRYYNLGNSLPDISDYNAFNDTSSSYWNLNYSTNYQLIDNWRAATNRDTNSIIATPAATIVLPGGTDPDDYRLKAGSPAIGAGRGGIDMGAYPNHYSTRIGTKPKNRPNAPSGLSAQ